MLYHSLHNVYIVGAFGKVFHGFLTNQSDNTVQEVAVKTIKGRM